MNRRAMPAPDLFGYKPPPRRQAEKVDLVDLELPREPGLDTERAYAVRKTWQHEPVWLPKSEAELQGGVFTFPRWMAIEKGLL